jgi:hypoxanthine-DNA glycosylase
MVEEHPFGYFIPEKANKLIIGSFPCYNGKDYGDWFYSGSGKSDFWKLIAEVYNMPYLNREDKQNICVEHGIAITDIALKITRTKGNCSDSNLKIVEINKAGISQCLAADIKAIYFTSKFVEKHFTENFPEVQIPSFVLPSPSPAANVYIAGLAEYKELLLKEAVSSPYDYRLLKYQDCLLNGN